MVLNKGDLEAKLKDEHELIKNGVIREDNPLDKSQQFRSLIDACRRGDLKTTQELISLGVNINGKDEFDYTPLIIVRTGLHTASLCGHYELVQLLLESGALAERGTFQGERVIYNALNDKIRNLLLQYDYSKSTDPLQPWADHITSLLSRSIPKTSDIVLTGGSETFALHKLLLSARSPYFSKKFADAPETATWKLSVSVPVRSFEVVLQYLYLGDLPKEFVDPLSSTTEEEILRGIDKLAKQLEVDKLWEAVLAGNDRRLARQRYQDEVQRAQQQVESVFRDSVLKHKMNVDTRKVNEIKWPHNNFIFADCLLQADEAGDEVEVQDDTERSLNGIPLGPSNGHQTNGNSSKTRRSVIFPAHKAFLIRSPYFETMFSSEFKEAQDSEYLHIIKVDCTPEVLEVMLTFLYTEKADCPLDLALDTLYISDMWFLDKLKHKAAMAISTLGSGNSNALVDRTHTETNGEGEVEVEIEPINVYDVIRAAWDLRVQRLEEFVARYIAHRLEDYIDEEDFADLIKEAAGRVKNREETDTIEILDDIRYYLSERFRLRFEDAGLEDMLDEEGEIDAQAAEEIMAARAAQGAEGGESAKPEHTPDGEVVQNGVFRTLDGELVEDEMVGDALNYQILLGKIDALLERLKLDA